MTIQRFIDYLRLSILLISLIFFSACSFNYQGDEFTFSAPLGFKTKEFETPDINPKNNPELLLFTQKGHLYFEIFRQKISPESDLDTVLATYISKISGMYSHYQFISQNTIEVNNQKAIEYVHREFQGEPYVQRREIWMEYNGWAYSLVCVDPVVATPGAIIPVSDLCIQLVEGFQFK